MVVWETRADNPKRAVAPANFIDWRRETTAFSGSPTERAPRRRAGGFDDFTATLTGVGEAQRIHAVSASGNFFEVLGVQAQIGRVMTPDDDRADAAKVAVLTDGLWHQLYGGVGRRARQDDDPQRHAAHHRRRAAAVVRHADGRRWRSLDDGRSRHPAQLSVRRRSHRGPRLAHHRRRRPARERDRRASRRRRS